MWVFAEISFARIECSKLKPYVLYCCPILRVKYRQTILLIYPTMIKVPGETKVLANIFNYNINEDISSRLTKLFPSITHQHKVIIMFEH